MKKSRFTALLTALILCLTVFVFAACDSGDDSKKPGGGQPTPPTQEEIDKTSIKAVSEALTDALISGIDAGATVRVTDAAGAEQVSMTEVRLKLAMSLGVEAQIAGKLAVAGKDAQAFDLTLKGDDAGSKLYAAFADTKLCTTGASLTTLISAVMQLAAGETLSPLTLAAAESTPDLGELGDLLGDCAYAEADGVATVTLPLILGEETLTLTVKLKVTGSDETKSYAFKSLAVDQTVQGFGVKLAVEFASGTVVINAPADAAVYTDVSSLVEAVGNTLALDYYEMTGSVGLGMFGSSTATQYTVRVLPDGADTVVSIESLYDPDGEAHTNRAWFAGNEFYFEEGATDTEPAYSKIAESDVTGDVFDFILNKMLQVPVLKGMSISPEDIVPVEPGSGTPEPEDPIFPSIEDILAGLSFEYTAGTDRAQLAVKLNIELLGAPVSLEIDLIAGKVAGKYYLTELKIPSTTIMGLITLEMDITTDPAATLPAGGIANYPKDADYTDLCALAEAAAKPVNDAAAEYTDVSAMTFEQMDAVITLYNGLTGYQRTKVSPTVDAIVARYQQTERPAPPVDPETPPAE